MSSSIEKNYLKALKDLQAQYAHEVLQSPKIASEFGYGQVSGNYQGLLLAEQLFKETIGEENERD